ncbi:winged helix-turn-helix transcriptional regulator [Frigoribacterium sp. ACAM 257]|uniref:ArsR/SmtB family transcription factor n=1 Tax=Frigoribacterium sp. ACAM 257 TaxID=2508998 RepID=UPI0011BA2B65|nr:metalloregulator ArsR/SmtB family transcription factor [Frigoribacterium sp. ACAM 257]TWX38461.1 winged helix-turn-helix transcriptional regulator [Frigoribacterium sp. ACAM 257]
MTADAEAHPDAQRVSLARADAETLAKTLRAVADPTRLQLLSMIVGSTAGEASVGDMAAQLGLTQPTVSHHLKIMLDDELLVKDQRGRHAWYSVTEARKTAIVDLLR